VNAKKSFWCFFVVFFILTHVSHHRKALPGDTECPNLYSLWSASAICGNRLLKFMWFREYRIVSRPLTPMACPATPGAERSS